MAEVGWRSEEIDWDWIEDDFPRDEPVPVIEEPRSREPLTYAGFMSAFPYRSYGGPRHGATGHGWPVVEVTALDCR